MLFRNLRIITTAASFVLTSSWLVGCGSKKVTYPDVTMPPSDREALIAALDRIDVALAEKAPTLASFLNDGATDKEIEHLRQALGGAINEPLEIWFRWHNGSSQRGLSLLPLGGLISLEESIRNKQMESRIPLIPHYRRNAIKVLDDLAGDGYFLDLTADEPIIFYDMTEEPSPRKIFKLTELAEFIATGFEKGVLTDDEHGLIDYEEETYFRFEEDYFE